MADVFISYSKTDAAIARRLSDALAQCGLSVWMDFSGLSPGKEFASEIEHQLDAARFVLVLWSKNSVRSEWVRDEADHAKRQGKLVSVMIDATELPPMGFRQRHAPSLRNWNGDAHDTVFRPVLDALGARAPDDEGVLKPNKQTLSELVSVAIRVAVGLSILAFAFTRAFPPYYSWLSGQPLPINLWGLEVGATSSLGIVAATSAIFLRRLTTLFAAAMFVFCLGFTVDNIVYEAQSDAEIAAANAVTSQTVVEPAVNDAAAAEASVVSVVQDLPMETQAAIAWRSWSVGAVTILIGLALVFLWWRRQIWAWWFLTGGTAMAIIVNTVTSTPEWMAQLPFMGQQSAGVYLLVVLSALALASVTTYLASRRGVIG